MASNSSSPHTLRLIKKLCRNNYLNTSRNSAICARRLSQIEEAASGSIENFLPYLWIAAVVPMLTVFSIGPRLCLPWPDR